MLKGVRTAVQVLAEPLDSLTRFMNCKKGYPPLWIRQKVGSLNDFEGSAGEYMAYLKLLCNLKPGMNVLDVGCGCGLMCLSVNENGTLPDYISPGKYMGLDVDRKLIGWCEKNLANDNTHFFCVTGSEALRLCFEESHGVYDIVLCKSLFTHLMPIEVVEYVVEIRRLLERGGKCLATFFILNDVQPKGRYRFKEWDGESYHAIERSTNPRAAVAYKEEWLKEVFDRANLSYDIYYGSWRGDDKGLSFQDIIILRR